MSEEENREYTGVHMYKQHIKYIISSLFLFHQRCVIRPSRPSQCYTGPLYPHSQNPKYPRVIRGKETHRRPRQTTHKPNNTVGRPFRLFCVGGHAQEKPTHPTVHSNQCIENERRFQCLCLSRSFHTKPTLAQTTRGTAALICAGIGDHTAGTNA